MSVEPTMGGGQTIDGRESSNWESLSRNKIHNWNQNLKKLQNQGLQRFLLASKRPWLVKIIETIVHGLPCRTHERTVCQKIQLSLTTWCYPWGVLARKHISMFTSDVNGFEKHGMILCCSQNYIPAVGAMIGSTHPHLFCFFFYG